MTSDLEMLEAAARAAGIKVHRGERWQSETLFREIARPNSPLTVNIAWDPISYGADTLDLEERLKISVMWKPAHGKWITSGIVGAHIQMLGVHEDRKRASVMAAAEIGKSMANEGKGVSLDVSVPDGSSMFDKWMQNPYTKVLMQSMDPHYVAAIEHQKVRTALQEADTIMGHDGDATEWRERWAHLWGEK
jgi:hypothetical protein